MRRCKPFADCGIPLRLIETVPWHGLFLVSPFSSMRSTLPDNSMSGRASKLMVTASPSLTRKTLNSVRSPVSMRHAERSASHTTGTSGETSSPTWHPGKQRCRQRVPAAPFLSGQPGPAPGSPLPLSLRLGQRQWPWAVCQLAADRPGPLRRRPNGWVLAGSRAGLGERRHEPRRWNRIGSNSCERTVGFSQHSA